MIGSLWEATAPERAMDLPPQEDITCDVAIIGAGFTGLRAAVEIASAGSDVAVFDAEHVGFGASGRSGGQVNPMLPVKYPEDLRKTVGDTYFERMAEISLGSADALFAFVERHQIRCDARQNGWLRADHSSAARTRSREAARLWNAFGAGFEFIDGADEVGRMTGTTGYGSATMSPKGGAIQPMSFVRGLADVATRAGAKIYGKSPARGLKRADGMWHMRVAGQNVTAQTVIVATNGYTDAFFPKLKRSILPLSPLQMATEELTDAQMEPLLPGGQTISDTRRLIMYCRREPGNRFVYGGMGYRLPQGGLGGQKWMHADAPRLFPSLKGVKWQYEWGGTIALTNDMVPHLHEPAPGLIAGLGYYGRGVAMSQVMGQVMAQRALGAAADSLALPVTPIRPYRFRLPQIFGAGTAMHVMRWQDETEVRAG